MECVTSKWSPAERRAFFDDLLTPTERIMFSKRLAVIYMLTKGYTFGAIQETLRVSPSTVARVWSLIEKGKYTAVIRRLQKQTQQGGELLQWLLDLMPPRHATKKRYAERMSRLGL